MSVQRMLAGAATAILVAGFCSPLTAAEVTDREFPVGGATALRLNVTGSIHAIPVAGLTSVKFHVVDSGPSTPPITVTTSRTGSRMNVSFNGPSQSLLPFVGATGYELVVSYPANLRLDLRELAGRVHVDAVTAPMELYDANGNVIVDATSAMLTAEDDSGDITVTGARTSISLTAGTGNVTATLAPGWRGSLVRLEASNGNLHLSVPAGFSARYDVTTGAGKVSNPLHGAKTGPLVFMLAEQGNVSLSGP